VTPSKPSRVLAATAAETLAAGSTLTPIPEDEAVCEDEEDAGAGGSSVLVEEIIPMETDRPDFTESSIVVPPGSLQFENGFTH
jgi:hypothetical protein